jgi:hypothetical protein
MVDKGNTVLSFKFSVFSFEFQVRGPFGPAVFVFACSLLLIAVFVFALGFRLAAVFSCCLVALLPLYLYN